MNPNYYQMIAKRISINPLLQSGVRLGMNLRIFEAMQTIGKPCDIATLAKHAHVKEPYLRELFYSFISSELMIMKDDKVFVPDWKVFNEVFPAQKLKYTLPLEKVAPILEKCFTEKGPEGYAHDEAPFVWDYVRDLQTITNIPLARELCEVIVKYTEKHGNVLDLGCGTGDLTIPFAKDLKASKVHGCDISDIAINAAKIASFKIENLTFSKEDIHKLPAEWIEKYDVVLMLDVLHDLQFPELAMKQVMTVLKKGGIAIIVDPKVSSNPLENVGNMLTAKALTLSTFWCIPSSSCKNGSGHGVGWGWQNKDAFLTGIPGLKILSRVCLINSDYNYAYICKKE